MDNLKLCWTDGLPYRRSRRQSLQHKLDNEKFKRTISENAINLAISYEGDTWLLRSAIPDGTTTTNK